MRVRWAPVAGGLAAAAAMIAVLASMVPGDGARVTVDHCYVTYDRQGQQHSRCQGHWTQVGRATSGPIYGVEVSQHWQALTVDPDPNYEWEVQVPQSARRQVAVLTGARAHVVSGFVPALLVVLGLVTAAFLGFITTRRIRRRVSISAA